MGQRLAVRVVDEPVRGGVGEVPRVADRDVCTERGHFPVRGVGGGNRGVAHVVTVCGKGFKTGDLTCHAEVGVPVARTNRAVGASVTCSDPLPESV